MVKEDDVTAVKPKLDGGEEGSEVNVDMVDWLPQRVTNVL
jgi:hypothetical protein